MALHGLASVTIGVPDVSATRKYYLDFGLTASDDGGWLSTTDGGRQLRLVERPRRQLVEVVVRADSVDDLARNRVALSRLGVPTQTNGEELITAEPITGTRVVVRVLPRLFQRSVPRVAENGSGRRERVDRRADAVLRATAVQPRRLGHAVLGSTNLTTSMRFFVDGLGFKASDYIGDKGAFLRCSDEHHNILLLAAPVSFLHHTSWQVDDVDEIGRGAAAMLEDHPERHIWGLGRHHAGSNFFWYLKDPAGNFSEYFSDMDCIVDDQLWTPEALDGAKGLFSWGPPPPPSFLHPDDLAALMTGAHSA